MPFDETRYERYAMQAETISQEMKPGIEGVEIDVVGNALGYTQEASREIARQMKDEGLAVLSFVGSTPTLKLTAKGHREIRTFRWPKWRRWIHNNLAATIAIAISLLSLILSVVNLLSK